MASTLIYALLAIVGLGFLVFIHEFGHYWVARKRGMRVEAFAIGFGKPLFTWERDGVKWHICMLPFGGYVRIAGMQKEGNVEPRDIEGGFFKKSPWDRIQVALAGPVVNIAFALVAFAVLWISGGRTKQFAEFTHRIGWVDPHSALYEHGVRPGDVIQKYDGRSFNGFKDLLIASVMSDKTTEIQGYKVDYLTGEKSDFHYTLPTYDDPSLTSEKLQTIGVLSPARYLIFSPANEGSVAGAPMSGSGLMPQDRLLWADGEVIFSTTQLSTLINESTAFLTIQRGDQAFQTKVPRVQLNDLKMTLPERGEIDDWQHESGLKGRLQDLYFIPYNLSPTAAVEGRLDFIDEQDKVKAFEKCQRCSFFNPLQEGDLILAVDGKPIHTSYDLLSHLQTRNVLVIVERDPAAVQKVIWTQEDQQFDHFSTVDLNAIISSIGTDRPILDSGTLHLLKPVEPKPLSELALTVDQQAQIAREVAQNKKEIEAIKDSQKRNEALSNLEKAQNKLVLGIALKDRDVQYNPSPFQLLGSAFSDTWRSLYGLVSGVLNPKYMQGPVGIVQVVQNSWMTGGKEALFWMGLISLNLGIFNLLPIPVLDGGHILLSLVEMITKKPLRAKTMERLILPFVGLLIAFFIYVTYHDITRLFSKFF